MTYGLMDISYLMRRAYHVMGGLEFNGRGTGALFGVLRDIRDYQRDLGIDRFVFAFDGGYDYRLKLFPDYKITRRTKYQDATPEEKRDRADLHQQIERLREEILHELGYRNILWQPGYEADDLIAATCQVIGEQKEIADVIIISADEDLWQLICDFVWCYNPNTKKGTTVHSFRRDWNLDPTYWVHIKALAGDVSDNIKGIDGIGAITAASFYTRTMKQCEGKPRKVTKDGMKVTIPCPCRYCAITSTEGLAIHNRNIDLVRLPAPGTMQPKLWEDCVDATKWNVVARKLGFSSLIDARAS